MLSTIGVLMLVESLRTYLRRRRNPEAPRGKLHTHYLVHRLPLKLRFYKSKLYISALLPVGIGFVIGVLSAILGVGGGFVLVPAMIYLLGMPTAVVIGTSNFQILFVAANVTFLQAATNGTVDVVLALLLILGGVVGAPIGVAARGQAAGRGAARPDVGPDPGRGGRAADRAAAHAELAVFAGHTRGDAVRRRVPIAAGCPGGCPPARRARLARRARASSRRRPALSSDRAWAGRSIPPCRRRCPASRRRPIWSSTCRAPACRSPRRSRARASCCSACSTRRARSSWSWSGRPARETVLRKQRFLGLWLNTGRQAFDDVPAYYAIAASQPLQRLLARGAGGEILSLEDRLSSVRSVGQRDAPRISSSSASAWSR